MKFTQTEAQTMYAALVKIKDHPVKNITDLPSHCASVDLMAEAAVISVDCSQEDRKAKNKSLAGFTNSGLEK